LDDADLSKKQNHHKPAATAKKTTASRKSTARVLPFAEILRRRQRESGPRRKGERTRDRVKLATVQALEERGYLRLRVTDICKRAKSSPAAFYLYFKNKEEVTVEVLTEFLHETFKLSSSTGTPRSLFEAIYESNLFWASTVRANAALMHCLLQLGDQVPKFKELNEKLNHEWFVHVTGRILKRYPQARVNQDAMLLAIYALGSMMDELTRKILVTREVHLLSVVEAIAPSDEALAEFLSVLWYRALFGAEPAEVKHLASRELLKFSAPDPATAKT